MAKLQREAAELVHVVEQSAVREAAATSRAEAAEGQCVSLRDACEAVGRRAAAALDERERQRYEAEARAQEAEARAAEAEASAAEAEAKTVQAAAEHAVDVARRTLEGGSEEVRLDAIYCVASAQAATYSSVVLTTRRVARLCVCVLMLCGDMTGGERGAVDA